MRYLLPNSVVDYIEQHGLYLDESSSASNTDKGKDREASSSGSRKDIPQ